MTSLRVDRPRIALAHQSVIIGDAIGNDIGGAYRLLDRLGFAVCILGEHLHPMVAERYKVMQSPSPTSVSDSFDLLLYHHSVEWPLGEEYLARFDGTVIAKYHNITPARFFEPYSKRYFDTCARGRAQTERLAGAKIVHWQADSDFNANELRMLGVAGTKVSIVPPFMRCDELFRGTHRAQYDTQGPVDVLFLGRRAPNKGHRHLLHTLASFKDLFSTLPIRLTVIGSTDEELASYYREIQGLEQSLGVSSHVRWLSHQSDTDVREALETSHVYLNLSEHEGFCVPVLEAQALGLPVVTSAATALRETVGPGQLVIAEPQHGVDYDLIAGLILEVASDPVLRNQLVMAGYRNVYQRFTSEQLENRFLDDIEPWLRPLS